jgi:hypothetical protein
MRRRDHIEFYRNSARLRAERKHDRELRERAVRGEELSREVAQKPRDKAQHQATLSFSDKEKS